jgi:hypothetical protein
MGYNQLMVLLPGHYALVRNQPMVILFTTLFMVIMYTTSTWLFLANNLLMVLFTQPAQ